MSNGSWLDRQPSYVRLFLVIFTILALVLLVALAFAAGQAPDWVPDDSLARDTLIPDSADAGRRHYTPATLRLHPAASITPVALPPHDSLDWRIGVGIPDGSPLFYSWPTTRPGWYLDWGVNLVEHDEWWGLAHSADLQLPDDRLGMEFVPMVRMRNGRLYPDPATLRELARRRPGLTWLIGNEPDVPWQDSTAPEVYAIAYHRAWTAVKEGDPTAQVAIAGLSQITPLRLAYLDRTWDFYRDLYDEEMPVDVWNMHAFVLREQRDTWGVNIPPGFEVEQRGMLWDVSDHDNLALVEQQVRAMRSWMRDHGQQAKPLWITEYGILMPVDYGFTPERVGFFMTGSFDLFRTLREPGLGMPGDDGRLVQRWNWYSARDSRYAAGNLFDDYGQVTELGTTFFDYLAQAR